MTEYLTVAEIYQMQHRLIDLFGGMHGVRDQVRLRRQFSVRRPATTIHSKRKRQR
jgi:hypothetical protein